MLQEHRQEVGQKTPGFGARHLKHEFDLTYGVNSIARVKRENGITRRRRRKHQKRNDLRAIKQACRPFTRFQMDIKYLDDISRYCAQIRRPGLPRSQYTIREIATGAQFLSYADSISVSYAEITIRRFLEHLRNCVAARPQKEAAGLSHGFRRSLLSTARSAPFSAAVGGRASRMDTS